MHLAMLPARVMTKWHAFDIRLEKPPFALRLPAKWKSLDADYFWP